ncbi:MAG TPA: 4-hydroxyphenylacetate 3-hydroxylase N-terminal domain-containing protein [Pseudonocardia sp.]|jgi:4-hydroxyphenylacetate 3-monooxygenase|nr:4-hydroxyphenylacetate 3-hydroxylase N-terminal domain-containing protein [Pseudonocardia sp.]
MTQQLVRDTDVEADGSYLVSGDEYRARLRDGREVWFRGERIDDVTTHDLTRPLIDQGAEIYDDQFVSGPDQFLTFMRPDGARAGIFWQVPRTPEDLVQRRQACEYIAWKTGALFGRSPDIIPWTVVGMLALESEFDRLSPDHKGHLRAYVEYAQRNAIHLAGCVVEPQGDRARSAKAGEDRDAVLRITKRTDDGIWISGARAVGSYSPQANDLLVGSIWTYGLRPDEQFWCCIPMSSPGLKLIAREGVHRPGASRYDHPVLSRGDEIDAFVIFDNVFVPHERVFSIGAKELHSAGSFNIMSQGEHWHVLNRLTVKAELMVGLVQLLVDTLGSGQIPTVRDQVGRLIQYAQTLRAGTLAAEQLATPVGGILLPDLITIAAVRSYGLDDYPAMVHLLQELCGQGLVMRFSESDFANAELNEYLQKYLSTAGASADQKNQLMNAIWDFTSSEHAGRTMLFENVNALPAFLLRQRLYDEYDRNKHMARVADFIGLEHTGAAG